jgi:hypothetical protein
MPCGLPLSLLRDEASAEYLAFGSHAWQNKHTNKRTKKTIRNVKI